jgi:serine-type D-Ala-D-Ala carboxypeptidase (penicillin-binding protein 5/6)
MRYQHRSIGRRWRDIAVRAVIGGTLVASVAAASAAAQVPRGDVPDGGILDHGTADVDRDFESDGYAEYDPFARPFPATTAASAIVVDRATGAVIGEKQPDRLWAPASTTKMMTALLTFEAVDAGTVSLSDTVTIQPDVNIEGGGQIGLAAGDTISLRDLLHIALLPSENDAASAVGTYVGSQPSGDPSWMGRAAFVQRMNDRAGELGLSNTRYINIAGRDPEDLGRENDDGTAPEGFWPTQEMCSGNDFDEPPCAHYTTARDLAALARVALDEPLFATFVQRTNWRTTTWRSATGAVRDRTVSNSNQLLPGGTAAYPGVYGVKTGTTHMARENLVSAASSDSRDVIAVVLGSDDDSTTVADRYTDSTALLDWALEPLWNRSDVLLDLTTTQAYPTP